MLKPIIRSLKIKSQYSRLRSCWKAKAPRLGNKSGWNRRRKRFYRVFMSGIEIALRRHERLSFLTLTSSPKSSSDPKEILRHWRILRKRIERRFGHIEYISVREYTKKGRVHLHIVLRGPYIDQRWLSKQWEDIHGAEVVDIRELKNAEQAARYLSKYLSKGMAARFSYSWGWIFRGSGDVWKRLCKTLFGSGRGLEEVLQIWKRILSMVANCELGCQNEVTFYVRYLKLLL